MRTACFAKLDVDHHAALPTYEGAIVVNEPGNEGSYMEWSDENACALHVILLPGSRYEYWVEGLDDTYRKATDHEISQYLTRS